jgi:hypothetical protein
MGLAVAQGGGSNFSGGKAIFTYLGHHLSKIEPLFVELAGRPTDAARSGKK